MLIKKFSCFLILLVSVFSFKVNIFANEIPTETPKPLETTKKIENATPNKEIDKSITKIPPISVERQNIDGKEILIKVFDVPKNYDVKSLLDSEFESDGYVFEHANTDEKKNESIHTKEVSESRQVESSTNDKASIVGLFEKSIPYEQDGFTGHLLLDAESIVTEVKGYKTNTSKISTTIEYPNLMYNDPSYVNQTATKNGHTLPLVNVDWVVTETGLSGDSLVPVSYKAIAYYSKSVSNKVATGYISTATYKGTLTKTTVDSIRYTITYEGIPVIHETTPLPQGTENTQNIKNNQKAKSEFNYGIILNIILFLVLAGTLVFLYFYIKSLRGAKIYNLMDSEFVCLGKINIDYLNPIIDLNELADIIQSNNFNIIIDKYSTKKLFGKQIAITLKDATIMHMIKAHEGEYRFSLEFELGDEICEI